MTQLKALSQFVRKRLIQYLIKKKVYILDENWNISPTESGFVTMNGNSLAFVITKIVQKSNVEIRELISEQEYNRLLQAAQMYLANDLGVAVDWRIDVMVVQFSQSENMRIRKIKHYTNLYWGINLLGDS